MNFEISFNILEEKKRAFLQSGFFKSPDTKTVLHRHHHTEIHMLNGGSAVFSVDGNYLELHAGEILVIPPHCLHALLSRTDGTLHKAFQTDCEADFARKYPISAEMIQEFMHAIEEAYLNGEYNRISLYLPLFCSLYHKVSVSAIPVNDYGFLICEFFSLNYRRSCSLSDLAQILCLSERQTERLVQFYTGYSFREALNDVRIEVAKQLIKSKKMSLEEISRYIGYQSYSGFWKALKKHSEKKFLNSIN